MKKETKEYQLSLFDNGWTDYRVKQPHNDQPILYYYLTEKPEDSIQENLELYKGKIITGPMFKIFKKKETSWYKAIAYWQPIKPLETETVKRERVESKKRKAE